MNMLPTMSLVCAIGAVTPSASCAAEFGAAKRGPGPFSIEISTAVIAIVMAMTVTPPAVAQVGAGFYLYGRGVSYDGSGRTTASVAGSVGSPRLIWFSRSAGVRAGLGGGQTSRVAGFGAASEVAGTPGPLSGPGIGDTVANEDAGDRSSAYAGRSGTSGALKRMPNKSLTRSRRTDFGAAPDSGGQNEPDWNAPSSWQADSIYTSPGSSLAGVYRWGATSK